MESFQPRDFQVLVVDDDEHIVDVIRMYLENIGLRVACCYDAFAALNWIELEVAHLIVLDIMMPDMDGWTLCQRVRELSDVPILMVTARGESVDKLKGFDLGADDYLVKPFDPNELVARAVSLLRRTYRSSSIIETAVLRFGQLCIDPVRHNVTVGGTPVHLTAREYHLLRIFAQNPNHILDRQQLLDLVWGIDYMGDDRVVDVFVKRLRKKMSVVKYDCEIVTVRGMGYKFEAKD